MIWEYANGIDESEVKFTKEKPKGIGNSITLPYDLLDRDKIDKVLLELTEQVTYRLRKEKMLANVVNVGIKTKDFKVISHQKKMISPTSSTKIIYQEVKRLMDELDKGYEIRLLSVRIDNLESEENMQLSLFERSGNKKQEKLDIAIDMLKDKYGYNFIKRAGELE